MNLNELVSYCDDYLQIRTIRDYPEALNGLQVGNGGKVHRIGAAVDVCSATVHMAAEQRADFLIVHHGLFWGGVRPLVGPQLERVSQLIRHEIALYSAHLPLDCHPDVGNAAVLARTLGLTVKGSFGSWQDQPIGLHGELVCDRDAFAHKVAAALGTPAKPMLFGPKTVRRIGIITGAGGSYIRQAAAEGLDTYITGEGSHHTYFDAEELRLNVFYGGHYATETFGVRAFAEHLSATFAIPWTFLDHPTGL